jgi:hypothetical protein
MTKHMILTETEAPESPTEDRYPPRWIRLPTRGHCPHTGLSRAAYYELIKTYLDRFAQGGTNR